MYSKENPYLSIVLSTRNDFYSNKSMAEVLKNNLLTMLQNIENNKIYTEIVITEWNPPQETESLFEALKDIDPNIYTKIRIITVPQNIHKSYKYNDKRNLIGEIAGNVAIRRSSGKFILHKSSDTFFSESIFKFISKHQLDQKCFYRCDKVEVKCDFKNTMGWESLFKKNIISRSKYSGSGAYKSSSGDFMLASRKSWHDIRGFPESDTVYLLGPDGETLSAFLGLGLNQVCLDKSHSVYKISHGGTYDNRMKNYHKKTEYIKNKFWMFNNIFIFLRIYSLYKSLGRFFLGVINIPKSNISGVVSRSIYRQQLTSQLRFLFYGGGFFQSKNWGLGKHKFNEKKL